MPRGVCVRVCCGEGDNHNNNNNAVSGGKHLSGGAGPNRTHIFAIHLADGVSLSLFVCVCAPGFGVSCSIDVFVDVLPENLTFDVPPDNLTSDESLTSKQLTFNLDTRRSTLKNLTLNVSSR